jgi:hypothetical protein
MSYARVAGYTKPRPAHTCGLTPVETVPNPFSRPRTESQIRRDLAMQLGTMLERWDERLKKDKEGK